MINGLPTWNSVWVGKFYCYCPRLITDCYCCGKGSYSVLEKTSRMDYVTEVNGQRKILHASIFENYIPRKETLGVCWGEWGGREARGAPDCLAQHAARGNLEARTRDQLSQPRQREVKELLNKLIEVILSMSLGKVGNFPYKRPRMSRECWIAWSVSYCWKNYVY